MSQFTQEVTAIADTHETDRDRKIEVLIACAEKHGYTVEDVDSTKPWGGYIGFNLHDAEGFIAEFFSGCKSD